MSSKTDALDKLNERIKSKKLNGVFLFYGEEQYLLDEKIQAIIKKVVSPGTEAFNVVKFNGDDISIDEVTAAIDQFPQMSPMKVILLSNTGVLNNAALNEYKIIKSVCSELPSDTCVIFKEESFDDKKHDGNVGFIKKSGEIVNFSYLPINRLSVYVDKFFQKNNVTILNSDISYLINLSGRSLGKLISECDKLLTYLNGRAKVTREDIDFIVSKSTETKVYEIVDSMIAGRTRKAYEQLKDLSYAKVSPNTVLFYMTLKLSEILTCKLLSEDELSDKEIISYFDRTPYDFVFNKIKRDCKRIDEGFLKYMISKGLLYDYQSKTGEIDAWTATEMYLSELTAGL